MLDAGVQPLCVLAHHDEIDALIAGGNARQAANGPEVCEQLELLAQSDVDTGKSTADGSGNRTFQS